MSPLADSLFTLHALDRLMAAVQARSTAFETELDAAPQILPCPHHGPGRATLNREASLAKGRLVHTCAACEHEEHLARTHRRIEAAGIPADVRHATLENFDLHRPNIKLAEGFLGPDRFLEKARLFASGQLRNLFLCGSPGIGKGHLAAALAITAITRGQSAAWITCARLFALHHRAYHDHTTEDILDRHARPALLVLDELCLRDLPADGEEILYDILDRRQKAGLPTLLLGNKPAKETRQWLGDRISDRLRSGRLAFAYGEWTSMRGTPADGASPGF